MSEDRMRLYPYLWKCSFCGDAYRTTTLEALRGSMERHAAKESHRVTP